MHRHYKILHIFLPYYIWQIITSSQAIYLRYLVQSTPHQDASYEQIYLYMYFSFHRYLPTIINSRFFAFGRMRRHISMVNIVLPLLKMDVNELMRAAIMTAIIRPRAPVTRHNIQATPMKNRLLTDNSSKNGYIKPCQAAYPRVGRPRESVSSRLGSMTNIFLHSYVPTRSIQGVFRNYLMGEGAQKKKNCTFFYPFSILPKLNNIYI